MNNYDMYKSKIVVNTNGYNLFYQEYSDLEDFLKKIISLPINKEVFYKLASEKVAVPGFNSCHSFEEAWNLCYYGWNQDYDTFCQKINFLQYEYAKIEIPIKDFKVYGFYPNIPRFLHNKPTNMICKQKNTINKQTIIINFNVAYSSYQNHSAIVNRGVCIINLINELEKQYNVVFNLFECATELNEMIYICINLKKEHEKVNVKRLYFPLVNPDFLRRLILRSKECCFDISYEWNPGYGTPYIPSEADEEYLNKTIYISTPNEMGIYGYDLKSDYENFINYISNQSYFQNNVLEKEEQKKKVH